MFDIIFRDTAREDWRFLKRKDQATVIDDIKRQLVEEPLVHTRNRKPLRPNQLATWELRIGDLRVFYDVEESEEVVFIQAVGWKERSKLFVRGEEVEL